MGPGLAYKPGPNFQGKAAVESGDPDQFSRSQRLCGLANGKTPVFLILVLILLIQ